jgi:hypothetical protein
VTSSKSQTTFGYSLATTKPEPQGPGNSHRGGQRPVNHMALASLAQTLHRKSAHPLYLSVPHQRTCPDRPPRAQSSHSATISANSCKRLGLSRCLQLRNRSRSSGLNASQTGCCSGSAAEGAAPSPSQKRGSLGHLQLQPHGEGRRPMTLPHGLDQLLVFEPLESSVQRPQRQPALRTSPHTDTW